MVLCKNLLNRIQEISFFLHWIGSDLGPWVPKGPISAVRLARPVVAF